MLELLNQLDGFEPTQNIKVIMATNRIDILDDALLRPGRIDRKIEFPTPSMASRVSVLILFCCVFCSIFLFKAADLLTLSLILLGSICV